MIPLAFARAWSFSTICGVVQLRVSEGGNGEAHGKIGIEILLREAWVDSTTVIRREVVYCLQASL